MERRIPPEVIDGRKHYATSCVVAALGLVLQLPIVDRGLVAIDEGQIASFAVRILRGEVIYRDFYTGIFPGIYYFCAGLFGIFGRDLLVTRVVQMIVNALIAVLVHRVALRVSTPFWAFLWATAYFPLVVASFPTLTMMTYSPLSMALALAALLVALRLITRPTRAAMVMVGVLLAGCGLMKQNYGGLAVTAIFLTMACAPALLRDATLAVRRNLITIVVAGSIATGLLLAPLFIAGAGPMFFRYTVGTVLGSQLTAFRQPLPPLLEATPSQAGNFLFFYLPNALMGYALRGEALLGVPLSESVRWILIRLGYGGALLVLASGWVILLVHFRRCAPETRLARVAVMVFGQLMFLGLFPSAIWSHLAAVIPPVLIVGAMASAALTELSPSLPVVVRRTAGLASCAICVLAFVSAAQITRDVRRWNPAPTDLPGATLSVPEQDAQQLRAAVEFLHSCAAPDEPIFVAPDLPALYFLSERHNATPYEMLIPGDIDEDVLIDALDTSRTDCIVYNPNMYSHFAPLSEDLPDFVRWMNESFAVQAEIGSGQRLWLGLVRSARDLG